MYGFCFTDSVHISMVIIILKYNNFEKKYYRKYMFYIIYTLISKVWKKKNVLTIDVIVQAPLTYT